MADAANANIVDELVVKLTLDAKQYENADKAVDKLVTKTEKKAVENDKKAKQRHEAQKKRFDETRRAAQSLGGGLMKLAGIAGAVLGVGAGAAGLAGMVLALTNTETALRRAAVATGLTNRQMSALSSTARRLGGDAKSGGDAFAGLAREQQLAPLTGQAPNLQALASFGVNIQQDVPHMLQQLQRTYRASNPQQQGFMESRLTAAGVSPDVVVAMKSSVDAIDAFNQSIRETSEENRKGLDAFYDAVSTVSNNLRNMANVVMTVAAPYVQRFGEYLSDATAELADFENDVAAAGGGVNGFMKVLEQRTPRLAALLHDLASGLGFLGEAVDVAVFGWQTIAKSLEWGWNQLAGSKIGQFFGLDKAGQAIVSTVKQTWREAVATSREFGPAPVASTFGIAVDDPNRVKLSAGAAARLAGGVAGATAANSPSKLDDNRLYVMNALIARGASIDQAAAITANAVRESGLRPDAYNLRGGGQGAQGIFQWRGSRIDAFRRRYGIDPRFGTVDQQIDFLMSDPDERRRMGLALGAGGSAAALGTRFSQIFEAHGKAAEDAARGPIAQRFADDYRARFAANDQSTGGAPISINGPVTVVANDPRQLVNGIQRQSGVQNYASGQR